MVEDWKESGSSRMSDAQRRLFNCACGDLAHQLRWHGFVLSKDDFRHLFSGTVLGFRTLPAWDNGDGKHGVIMLGGSSLNLTKSEATDAITLAFMLGDDPRSQNIEAEPIDWCDVIKLARGIRDYEETMA